MVVEASVIFEISSEYLIIMIEYPELVYNIGWLFQELKSFFVNQTFHKYLRYLYFTLQSCSEIKFLYSNKNLGDMLQTVDHQHNIIQNINYELPHSTFL